MYEPNQTRDDTQEQNSASRFDPYRGCRRGCAEMGLIGCLPTLLLIVLPPVTALLWLFQYVWSLILD
jgi:hypothetical protein